MLLDTENKKEGLGFKILRFKVFSFNCNSLKINILKLLKCERVTLSNPFTSHNYIIFL